MDKSELLKEQIEQNKRLDKLEDSLGDVSGDVEERFVKIENNIIEVEEDIDDLEEWQEKQDEEISILKGSVYYVGSVPSFVDESDLYEPTETTKMELEAYVILTEGRPQKVGDTVSSLATGNQYLCKQDPDNPPDGLTWIIWSKNMRVATKTELGMIKVGDGLKAEIDGTLSEDLSYRHNLATSEDTNAQLMNVRMFDTVGGEDKDVVIEEFKKIMGISIPAGSVIPWAGNSSYLDRSTIPDGWLMCDGKRVYKEVYKELYKVIGETYNKPEDPLDNMFRLPDLRYRIPVGKFDANDPDLVEGKYLKYSIEGNKIGDIEQTLLDNNIPNHNHTINEHTHTFSGNSHNHGLTWPSNSNEYDGTHQHYMYFRTTNKSGKDTPTVLSYDEDRFGTFSKQTESMTGKNGGGHKHDKLSVNNTTVGGTNSKVTLTANADNHTGDTKPISIESPMVVMNYIIKY